MKIIIRAIILLTLLSDSGCVFHAKPQNNIEFASIDSLKNIEGTYLNKGETDGKSVVFLSYILWPKESSYPIDSLIKYVCIKVLENNSIEADAYTDEGCVREKIFSEGDDYKIIQGRLRLIPKPSSAHGAGSPIAGPSSGYSELGLDKNGNGKYKSSWFAGGLVYMILPFVGGETTEVRFVKLEKTPTHKLVPASQP